MYVIRQMSVLNLVNYFALHRLGESLPCVVLDRHAGSDFHGFASDRLDSDISACH